MTILDQSKTMAHTSLVVCATSYSEQATSSRLRSADNEFCGQDHSAEEALDHLRLDVVYTRAYASYNLIPEKKDNTEHLLMQRR